MGVQGTYIRLISSVFMAGRSVKVLIAKQARNQVADRAVCFRTSAKP